MVAKPWSRRSGGRARPGVAWRWAAAQFARDPSIERLDRRRKLRGDPDEGYATAMRRAAEMLLGWARTVHKRPSVREGGESYEDRRGPH